MTIPSSSSRRVPTPTGDPERCLWVIAAEKAGRSWCAPDAVRCRPDGRVFCGPCLARSLAATPDPREGDARV